MWYAWLEEQRYITQSLIQWGTLSSAAWTPAESPRMLTAAPYYDWFSRLAERAGGPPSFDIPAVTIDRQAVPIAQHIVDRTPFCTLRQFTRATPRAPPRRGRHRVAPPSILLCAPLAGHHAVMLRETIETLLQDGDVYVTDWIDARDVPLCAGNFGLDDYVLVVKRFLRRLGCGNLHVIAICQATVPTLAALALLADSAECAPLSVTLMGGPIDTRLNPTTVDKLALSRSLAWFRDTMIDIVPVQYMGSGRRVYPGFIQHSIMVAASPQHQLALELDYWSSRLSGNAQAVTSSLRSLNEYTSVLDMAEDYFLDTIRVIFQEQSLARGKWRIGSRDVRPQDLSTALCTVEGERDNITGCGQTHAAHTLCPAIPRSKRRRLTISDCDHYELFTGAKWHEEIHPAIVEFWRLLRRPMAARNTF